MGAGRNAKRSFEDCVPKLELGNEETESEKITSVEKPFLFVINF